MSGKPDRSVRMGGKTFEARDTLIKNIRSMFAWIGPKAANQTLLEVFEHHYQPFANPAKGTCTRYRCELRRFERFTGNPKLRQIDSQTIATFRQRATEDGLKPSTIEGSVKIVKAIVRFSRDAGWIKSLPIFGKPLRIEEPIPEPATLEEIELLYRFADHASRPSRGDVSPADWWRAFLCLELWCGFRITDILRRFHWDNIENDHIRFRAAKTSRLHVFPRHPVVDAHLRLMSGWSDNLVVGMPACRAQPQTVREEMACLCRDAGIRHLTPQNLRQACVTSWLSCGESAGRIVHGSGLSVTERHYAGKLTILRNAMRHFEWPPSMERLAPPEDGQPGSVQFRVG